MTHVLADSLVKEFGDLRVVDEVSFEVDDGEFLVLVGPSGCGKTTTLRMLVGLEQISSGSLQLGGRVVNDVRPKHRHVAMVFQDYAIFPHLTVFENIAYGLRSRRTPRRVVRRRVPEAARTFRIEHLLERKPRQLSGGERQRVALARAMVRDAELYLYDEPLSNLDAQLRHQAREDILTLHRQEGKATVYVTHDQSEAMALGDRIAVLSDGRIQQLGTGTELYEHPVNLFVAHFVGTPSINLFDARLEAVGDEVLAKGDDFSVALHPSVYGQLRSQLGRKVTLGVRPEHLQVPRQASFEVTDANTIHGVVSVIEPSSTGSTVYLTTTGDEPKDFTATFRVRVPMSYLDQQIPLAVDTSKLHVFDAATGEALVRRSSNGGGSDAVSR